MAAPSCGLGHRIGSDRTSGEEGDVSRQVDDDRDERTSADRASVRLGYGNEAMLLDPEDEAELERKEAEDEGESQCGLHGFEGEDDGRVRIARSCEGGDEC